MERMLAVMDHNPAAAFAGLVAMVCLAVWPLFRTRSMMLSIYVGNNLAFVLHYALLHHWTAVAMNGLIAIQTVAAIGLVRYPRLRLGYFAVMPVMVGVAFLTWQGSPSFLSAAATALSTLGRMQGSETVLRTLLLASTPFWAGHDLVVGSLPGVIADLLSMAIGAAMLLRRLPTVRLSPGTTARTGWPAASKLRVNSPPTLPVMPVIAYMVVSNRSCSLNRLQIIYLCGDCCCECR
jgi:hypothetical protein